MWKFGFFTRDKRWTEGKLDHQGQRPVSSELVTSLFYLVQSVCSASVTKPAHPPTSPPTKWRRREAMTASKRHLAPQTKPNNPQREHYSYIANNTLLFAQQHFDEKFLLGSTVTSLLRLYGHLLHMLSGPHPGEQQ